MTKKQKYPSQWLGFDSVMLQASGNWKTLGYELTVLAKLFQALHRAVRMGSKSSTFPNRQEKKYLTLSHHRLMTKFIDCVVKVALEALTHVTICTLSY